MSRECPPEEWRAVAGAPLLEDRVTAPTRGATRTTVTREETKASFLTTELYAFVATVVGILVAAAQADNLDAHRAWTLIAAVSIGYMVSRGLAKSGSAHRDRDRDSE